MNDFKKYLTSLEREAVKSGKYASFSLELPYKTAQGFYLLPQRESELTKIGACKIFDKKYAVKILKFLDGKADYIFIDAETKNPEFLDIENLAKSIVKKSRVLMVKVNDFTAFSADLLVSQLLNVSEKKIIIVGLGNIGSKLALKLSERNAKVFVTDKNPEKAKAIISGLNVMKANQLNKITSFEITNLNYFNDADAIIGFSPSYVKSISREMVMRAKKNALILDGGIGTIDATAFDLPAKFLRLDIRPGFSGYIDSVIKTDYFISNILGERKIDGKKFVAGGIISDKNSVILDSIKNPSKAVGLSDGKGGLIRKSLNNVKLDKNLSSSLFNSTFVFRVDGGSSDKNRPRNEQGTGHIFRSLILAEHLREKGYNVFFIMKELPGIKIVEEKNFKIFRINENADEPEQISEILKNLPNVYLIIDRLGISSKYVKKIKAFCKKVITIDNKEEGALYADLNLYPLFDAPEKFKNKFYSEPNLVLLRKEFYKFINKNKKVNSRVNNILVSLGGTDPTKTTLKVIKALKNIDSKITIACGPAFNFKKELENEIAGHNNFRILENAKMAELIFNSDIAIVSGGITPYECAALGTPCVVICHNKEEAEHSFRKHGFSLNLGITDNLDHNKIYKEVFSLLQDCSRRMEMSKNGRLLFKKKPLEFTFDLILNEKHN